jgi:hypothetical protein
VDRLHDDSGELGAVPLEGQFDGSEVVPESDQDLVGEDPGDATGVDDGLE